MAYLKNRLNEIEAILGPLTIELGLKPRLRRGEDIAYLTFEREDEHGVVWHAPVKFVFPLSKYTGQKEITWDNVRLQTVSVEIVPVGTNGWSYYSGDVSGYGEPMVSLGYPEDGTLERAFEEAKSSFLEYSLIPEYDAPGVIENTELVAIWPELRQICLENAVEQIDVGRDADRNEFYRFEHEGRVVELVYDVGCKVKLLVDQAQRWTGSHYDFQDVERELKTMFHDLQEKRQKAAS